MARSSMDFPSSSLTRNDIPETRTFGASSAWHHAFLLPATHPPWCVSSLRGSLARLDKPTQHHSNAHEHWYRQWHQQEAWVMTPPYYSTKCLLEITVSKFATHSSMIFYLLRNLWIHCFYFLVSTNFSFMFLRVNFLQP
jgi:hypothetical protein